MSPINVPDLYALARDALRSLAAPLATWVAARVWRWICRPRSPHSPAPDLASATPIPKCLSSQGENSHSSFAEQHAQYVQERLQRIRRSMEESHAGEDDARRDSSSPVLRKESGTDLTERRMDDDDDDGDDDD
jgi:hypothetical protein